MNGFHGTLDAYLTNHGDVVRYTPCACCGRESSEIDSLGRCPEPACALASRIDGEVELRTIAATLRLSRLTFGARSTPRPATSAVIGMAVAA